MREEWLYGLVVLTLVGVGFGRWPNREMGHAAAEDTRGGQCSWMCRNVFARANYIADRWWYNEYWDRQGCMFWSPNEPDGDAMRATGPGYAQKIRTCPRGVPLCPSSQSPCEATDPDGCWIWGSTTPRECYWRTS